MSSCSDCLLWDMLDYVGGAWCLFVGGFTFIFIFLQFAMTVRFVLTGYF